MTMSDEARRGLLIAVRRDPRMARDFLGILREHPNWVQYKPADPYGPLSLMLSGHARRDVAPGVTIIVATPPLSNQEQTACAAWNAEWLRGDFTKAELADAIATILSDLQSSPKEDGEPILHREGDELFLYRR